VTPTTLAKTARCVRTAPSTRRCQEATACQTRVRAIQTRGVIQPRVMVNVCRTDKLAAGRACPTALQTTAAGRTSVWTTSAYRSRVTWMVARCAARAIVASRVARSAEAWAARRFRVTSPRGSSVASSTAAPPTTRRRIASVVFERSATKRAVQRARSIGVVNPITRTRTSSAVLSCVVMRLAARRVAMTTTVLRTLPTPARSAALPSCATPIGPATLGRSAIRRNLAERRTTTAAGPTRAPRTPTVRVASASVSNVHQCRLPAGLRRSWRLPTAAFGLTTNGYESAAGGDGTSARGVGGSRQTTAGAGPNPKGAGLNALAAPRFESRVWPVLEAA
jgi:hypothetical protein